MVVVVEKRWPSLRSSRPMRLSSMIESRHIAGVRFPVHAMMPELQTSVQPTAWSLAMSWRVSGRPDMAMCAAAQRRPRRSSPARKPAGRSGPVSTAQ